MSLVYVYGIVRAADARPETVAGIDGIAEAPLRLLAAGPRSAPSPS